MKKSVLFILLVILSLSLFTACKKSADDEKSTDSGSQANVAANGALESTEAAPEADGTDKVVRIAYPAGTNTGDFMGGVAGVAGITQEQGYFEEELGKIGYQIKYVPSGAGVAISEALVGNQADIAFYSDFAGTILRSKGVAVDLLGIIDSQFVAGIIAGKNSGIKTISDLKSKTIGYTQGTYTQKYILELLDANEISTDDVELVNVTTDSQTALIAGDIDALAHGQTLILTLVEKDAGTVIAETYDNPEFGAQIIFVGNNDYVKANPEVPVALDKALLRGKEYVRQNPDDSYNSLTKTGYSLDVIRSYFKPFEPDFDQYTIGITEDSISRLKTTQEFMLAQGLISSEFDVAEWADNSYYEKANSELGINRY